MESASGSAVAVPVGTPPRNAGGTCDCAVTVCAETRDTPVARKAIVRTTKTGLTVAEPFLPAVLLDGNGEVKADVEKRQANEYMAAVFRVLRLSGFKTRSANISRRCPV